MLLELSVETKSKLDVVDIHSKVVEIVNKSTAAFGLCTVYVPHTTCAVMICENYDPEIGNDLQSMLSKLIPLGIHAHDRIDGDGEAHIKANIIGPSQSIPIKDSKLMTGRWQNIMLAEFAGPRKRTVYVNIVED